MTDSYDELVLATGAKSIIPDLFLEYIENENIFTVRNIQSASNIYNYIKYQNPKSATIIGAGFIGLEMAEQLTNRGIDVTIIQRSSQILKHMDTDMAYRVQLELENKNVAIKLNTIVSKIESNKNKITELQIDNHQSIQTDLVILAAGVEPNTSLIHSTSIETGISGAIVVNKKMKTTAPHIYAVGDVAQSYSLLTNKPIYRPLGSTANKMGRIAGDILTGGKLEHRGILGTGIVRVFDLDVAYTGLTETEAIAEGFEIETLYSIKPDHADYLGGKEMTIKAIADKNTGRVLGAQVTGVQGVDKRIDVLATAMSFGAVAEDLFHLDLAYAPPFATTKDPILYTGMALDNAIHNNRYLMTPTELINRQNKGEVLQIIDTRIQKQFDKSSVAGSVNIPFSDLRRRMSELDKQVTTITYCNKGVTGNAAQNLLLNHGFTDVYNLSGGNKNYQLTIDMNNK